MCFLLCFITANRNIWSRGAAKNVTEHHVILKKKKKKKDPYHKHCQDILYIKNKISSIHAAAVLPCWLETEHLVFDPA